ncbi:MAG: hydrogenase maturation factor [Clostridia bacterium]|nr:hydrogenase maturation factor [Clostridia bacterium]
MKTGKLRENIYHRSVVKQLKTKNDTVLFDQNHGLQYSIIDSEQDDVFVLSQSSRTDYFPGYEDMAVYTAVNDVVTSGASMVGILIHLIIPEAVTEKNLKQMIAQMEEVCAFLHTQIMGIDTKVSVHVLKPIITVTGIGKNKKDQLILSTQIKPGNDLILTKWIGIEGTFMIAEKFEKELLSRYSFSFIQTAKKYREQINLAPEAATAGKSGVTAMYSVSEGGIFGALWEFAEAGGVGLEIDLKKIPVKQETIELCEFYGLNPYELLSGGSMLIAADDGNGLVRELEKEGISSAIIGKVVDGNDRIVYNGEDRRFLEPAKQDEIYQLFES